MINRRFTEDPYWNAFGAALAGVFAVVLSTFMVTQPLCTSGVPVLPLIRGARIVTLTSSDLRVSVSHEGFANVSDDFAREPIEEKINTALASGRYHRVVINADRHAKFGALSPIFRAARVQHVPIIFETDAESILEHATSDRVAAILR
jgi:biopolymer transport protein ExbD